VIVEPSTFRPGADEAASTHFEPYASFRLPIEEFGYEEEEWLVEGTAGGGSYLTTTLVRLPRDRSRFSGTVVVEPLHFSGIAPISLYSSTYLMNAGHGWAMVVAQRTTLDHHVRPHDPGRYADLRIDGPPGVYDFQGLAEEELESFWAEQARWNAASSGILAQAGAAIRGSAGPFTGLGVGHVILAGHSQTGSVVTRYLREAHGDQRRADGGAVYDGYFPSGFPFEALPACEVPVVQVVSDGDVSNPNGTFMAVTGRPYRREDGDEPGDRFRLYELAGMPHMGTRHPPFDDLELWRGMDGKGDLRADSVMSSLPHNELFDVTLDHLVRWVTDGTPPPRAPRLEVGADGHFAVDEHGNTRGGVRCPQMDVPRARYFPNVPRADGTLSSSTVGTEEPFPDEVLRELYGDPDGYRQRFEQRLQELLAEGWVLPEDVDAMREDLTKVGDFGHG